MHAAALKLGLELDQFVASALIHAYLELGLFGYARYLFDSLPDRDVVLWNAMINGLVRKGEFGSALEWFRRMGRDKVMPSGFTVTGVLSVFTGLADLDGGRTVHGLAVKSGYERGVSVGNALVDLYGKCHEVEDAVRVFDGMEERDLLSWNSMVSAFQYNADHGESLRCFGRMMRHAGVLPDAVTLAAVLPACSQVWCHFCISLKKKKSWLVSYLLVSLSLQAAALMHGREIHAYMVTSGMSFSTDVFVHNALMDMYAKSGTLADSKRVFDRMPARDVASWNIMIHGYAAHGFGVEALELFDEMCLSRLAPDEVTFVGLLSACSHAGLVEPGREIFQRMEAKYGVVPVMEHYSCMVDLLGRAGRLQEAQEVAEQAKEAGVWRAYLAACKMHGRMEHAVEAAEQVVGLEPKASGGYVLLANAYGSAGRFGELEEVRGVMWKRRVRKVTGCSWVEVAGSGLHTFVTGDQNHTEMEGIYGMLYGLVRQMREFGSVPDVFVQETNQEVEEEAFCVA